MQLQELESLLRDSLEDFKLSHDEKVLFRGFSSTLNQDQLGFIRNKAFEISRSYIKEGGENAVRVHNWLDRLVKVIQPLEKKVHIQSEAYFSPGSDCRNKIISLIDSSKKTVDICVFTISDNRITQSILAAHKRGVVITVISDNDKSNDKGSDVDYLSNNGVNVLFDRSSYHMHHKFAIFDGRLLLNGSFNWTRSASDFNEENIMVLSDASLVSQFSKRFAELKNTFSK